MEKVKMIICFVIMLLSIYFIYGYYDNKNVDAISDYVSTPLEEVNIISKLREEYENDDIVAFLEIPDVLALPIVQTSDNEYYLNHGLYKEDVKSGASFLDYRIGSLDDRKLIIYGHNSSYRILPFTSLLNYQDKEFYSAHPKMFLYTEDGKKTYNIFSSYVENKDFDYVNLNSFNGLTFYEHILKLKEKSLYDTGTVLNENSKILIIQTCSFDNSETSSNYQLVIGVLE